ncbi:MAG: hypothetical protein ABIR39_06885, partial [Nocardioides sp.]
MSTTAALTPTPRTAGPVVAVVTVVSRKTLVIFAVLTAALAALVLLRGESGDATFRLASDTDFFQLPELSLPSVPTAWLLTAVCAVLTAESLRRYLAKQPTPGWILVAFAVAWMVGFLTEEASGGSLPVVGLLAGSLALAVPLIFGALGGVLGERAGVVNIAIDGQLLLGAFAAAIVGSTTGSPWAG